MIELIIANPLARTGILLLLFVVVFALTILTLQTILRRASVREQLRAIGHVEVTVSEAHSLRERRDGAWSRLVDRIERTGLNLTDTKSDALREKLVAAGFDSPLAPRIYTLIRLLLVIALPSLLVGISFFANFELSIMRLYIFGTIAALLGLYVPALFVRAKADRRREQVINGFPDSLDLMLVCVEAGLGLEAALDRVGHEMTISHPLVSKMLTTATLQLRAGASRESALRRMADSSGVEEINAFAALLIQSDKLGTSIATTLRVYAEEMREQRRMRAEERAHRIPVLISIPLVVCMLPVMIGVLMLPAAVRVVREVFPAMSGG